MRAIGSLKESVEGRGFAICEGVLSALEVKALLRALERIDEGNSVRRRGGIFAVRNLLDVCREVRELAESNAVRRLVEPVLGAQAFAVRGILFDKVPEANWKVPWHQDMTIAVESRVDAEGFGPWTVKADVVHVQPPAFVLERMLSVRLHLDECGEENGALRVIPGSHRRGRISEREIEGIRAESTECVCTVGVGAALIMRPLLLHASSSARVAGHRGVIHIDFAAVQLPEGMRWYSEAGANSYAHCSGVKTHRLFAPFRHE